MARITQQLRVEQGFESMYLTGCRAHAFHSYIFTFLKKQILATLCSMWDLSFRQGIEPEPLHWRCRILTTGLLGKSLPLHL